MRLHIRPGRNYLLLAGELRGFHLKSDFTLRCMAEGVDGGEESRQTLAQRAANKLQISVTRPGASDD